LFSLYLAGIYYFSLGIKAKKSKPLSAQMGIQMQDAFPTPYELASLAAQLYRETPEGQKTFVKDAQWAVQKAETLWKLARLQAWSMRRGELAQNQMLEKEKKLLENVKRPKVFPISFEEMIQGLIPKRSVRDRKQICQKFLRTYEGEIKGETEYAEEAKANSGEAVITATNWSTHAARFLIWYPAYQRDVKVGRARKAAQAKQKKGENQQLTQISSTESPKQQ
jgi:hypothetical protein